MKKIKKAFTILKEEGAGPFLSKIHDFFSIHSGIIRRNSYLMLHKKAIIKELRDVTITEVEPLITFISTKFIGAFTPGQIRPEFTALLNIEKEQDPKVVLEIGTSGGGSLFCFSKLANPTATVISIDLPGGTFGGGYPRWKIPFYSAFTRPEQSFHLLREDSHAIETLKKVQSILKGKQIDFLFIDGDHTYEGVKKDFDIYSPLVKKGGIIALHDIVVHPIETHCLVHEFWAELKKQYPDSSKELITTKDQRWAGIGVLFV